MLDGKVALVTGGTRGIGRAIALKLAAEGADVAVFATKENDASKAIVEEIEALGRKAAFFVCNVADAEQVNTAVAGVVGQFGRIDILVNNAGITKDMLLLQMKEEDFDSVVDVNLKGCFHMIKACIRPFVKQRYGRIINISSVVGMMGNVGQANYAASKAGIIGLTKSVAKEYASKGITCNAVAPGYIQTEMTGALSEQAAEAILSQIPVKRYGIPEDVAHAVSFLAADTAAYITGEVIKIDGGMYV